MNCSNKLLNSLHLRRDYKTCFPYKSIWKLKSLGFRVVGSTGNNAIWVEIRLFIRACDTGGNQTHAVCKKAASIPETPVGFRSHMTYFLVLTHTRTSLIEWNGFYTLTGNHRATVRKWVCRGTRTTSLFLKHKHWEQLHRWTPHNPPLLDFLNKPEHALASHSQKVS